jgi:hypothetical protein
MAAIPNTISASVSGTSTVRVTVTTFSGIAVLGDAVTFTLSGTCGSLSSSTATTNSSGVATVVYTSATMVGFCTITAREANTGAQGSVVVTQTS